MSEITKEQVWSHEVQVTLSYKELTLLYQALGLRLEVQNNTLVGDGRLLKSFNETHKVRRKIAAELQGVRRTHWEFFRLNEENENE